MLYGFVKSPNRGALPDAPTIESIVVVAFSEIINIGNRIKGQNA